MSWSLYTTSNPAETAVDVEELRDHIGIVHTADNELLQVIAEAATDWVEQYTGRRLITQSVTEEADGFPYRSDYWPLHVYPVNTIVIKYDDTSDVEQTLDAADYWTHFNRLPPMVEVKTSWPSTYDRRSTVRYEMQVGQAKADIPKVFTQALKMLGNHLYDNRSLLAEKTAPREVPFGVRSLLRNYRIWQS